MQYRTVDLKVDQFISYLNDGKINLIPPFQRGHVWPIKTRMKLIENILKGRPIPAVFLYRDAAGDKYTYNILDGKQRLESLILFVGNHRPSMKIKNPQNYFYDKKIQEQANFKVAIDGEKQGLVELDESVFRDFREYVIPTIEITLSDDSAETPLDEMIDLFVDINQYGVKVNRFDIVKAMTKDPLLKNAFELVSLEKTSGKVIQYKAINNEFTFALKRLQVVSKLGSNARVDRMWELMVEMILFVRDKKHRTPVEILKNFIKAKHTKPDGTRVTKAELSELRSALRFVRTAYGKNKVLAESRLAMNQIHFYSMITAIIGGDLLAKYPESDLIDKLAKFASALDGGTKPVGKLKTVMKEYESLTAKHTTHPGKRLERQNKFVDALDLL